MSGGGLGLKGKAQKGGVVAVALGGTSVVGILRVQSMKPGLGPEIEFQGK